MVLANTVQLVNIDGLVGFDVQLCYYVESLGRGGVYTALKREKQSWPCAVEDHKTPLQPSYK